MAILLLGEALVDLVCEEPVASIAHAPAFVPHVGGSPANVAITAARLGARVALAGGVGADAWGAWLLERIGAEGVDTSLLATLPGQATAVAFVAVDADGEPDFLIHAGAASAAMAALAERLPAAVGGADALVLTTGTMVDEEERAVTLAARDAALAGGVPVVYDPNLRPGRWANTARAVSVARGCVEDAFLVKCSHSEATALTGEEDPAAAAQALLAGGAQHVVVTLGPAGALLRGPGLRLDVPGVPARTRDATGAGDAVTGVLLGQLAASDFYPPTLAAALPAAVAASAAVTEVWGALA
ncbi:Fructokinase [Paraconexibacter sp. AEG42_29]|uniref:Fructokinase n=1 Tax=Paraconexibacter sp. AEG42_29 TaxID=2997339 RepID=A0AAU7AP23_9ACTN